MSADNILVAVPNGRNTADIYDLSFSDISCHESWCVMEREAMHRTCQYIVKNHERCKVGSVPQDEAFEFAARYEQTNIVEYGYNDYLLELSAPRNIEKSGGIIPVVGRTYTTARIFERVACNHAPVLHVPVTVVRDRVPVTFNCPVHEREVAKLLRNGVTRRIRWKFVGDIDHNAWNPLISVPDYNSMFVYDDPTPWPTFMCDSRHPQLKIANIANIVVRDSYRGDGHAPIHRRVPQRRHRRADFSRTRSERGRRFLPDLCPSGGRRLATPDTAYRQDFV